MLQPIHDALRRNATDVAIDLARKGLAQMPSSPDMHHLLALGLIQKGDIRQAEDSLHKAIALAPETARFHVTRAELAFARNDAAAARSDLSLAVKYDPNSMPSYVGLARIALVEGDVEGAEAQLKLARLVDPDHPAVLQVQGQLALARGDADTALGALNRAVQLNPADARLHFDLGLAYQARGLPAVAAQALRNAIKLNPRLGNAHRLLVSVLLEGGEHAAARDQLQQVLKHTPTDAGGWGLLGGIEFGLGNVEAAEHATLQSLVLVPNQPLLVTRLMELWVRTQDGVRARTALDAVLQHQSGSDLLWNARFSLDALNPAGDDVLERWRAARPGSLVVEEAAAQRAEAFGRVDEATQLAEQVLTQEPMRVGANLVLVRLQRDSAPEAALDRLNALSAQPLDAGLLRSMHSLRGVLLNGLGRHAEALECWRSSLAVAEGERAPGLPLPGFLPAGPTLAADAPRGAQARLLWVLPGVQAAAALSALGGATVVLTDRFNSDQRNDGLGPLRPQTGHHGEAGAEAAWLHHLSVRGLSPEGVIDALPHCDAGLLSALPDARLLVLLTDPRDLLLSWLAFGSAQGYVIDNPELLGRWLAEACAVVVERLQTARERTALLRIEDLQSDPVSALAAATAFFGIETPAGLYAAPRGSDPNPARLASGTWRSYTGVLDQVFASLTPLAVELGYPAE
jgi:tetratricopeptide (TPR) repeat protein